MKNIKNIKRNLWFVIILLTLSNCKNIKDEKAEIQIDDSIQVQKKDNHKWIQFQRKPVNLIDTQPPYEKCYFIIKNSKFYYYKNDSLNYIDEFVTDHKLNRTIFKDHNLDEILFEKDSNEVTLKRDNYEGEYEYFKRDK